MNWAEYDQTHELRRYKGPFWFQVDFNEQLDLSFSLQYWTDPT